MFRRSLIIEWGDCDAAGIVFYPRYFAMFDWSTTSMLTTALAMRWPDVLRTHGIIGIPMADTRARFLVPSGFGDDITIETRIDTFGRSSFNVHHRLLKGETLGAECWEKRVWVARRPDGRLHGVPVPEEVRAKLI